MNFVCNSYHVIDPNFGRNIFMTELGESSQKYGQKYGEVMSMVSQIWDCLSIQFEL